MSKLTAKQEAFAVKYVECDDASEAYRFAYDCEGMANTSIHVNACKQVKHAKIALRIAELRSKTQKIAENKFTIGIERRLKWLEEIINAGLSTYIDQQGNKRRENLAASKGAIETLNAMLGTDDNSQTKPVKVFVGVEDASKS